MFKKMIKSFVLVGFVAITFSSLPTFAEEESVTSGSADVSILSQYVWRGYAYSDSSFVVQPSITGSYKGLSLNVWGNLDMNYYAGDESEFNETDLTLSYDMSFDKVSVGLGYIYYGLESTEDSQEFYVSVGVDTLLSPSLTIYRDVDEFPGWYYNLGIAYSVPLGKILNGEDVALDLSAAVGYYDIGDYSEFHDGNISASVTFPINSNFSITPALSYAFGLTDDSKADLKAGSADSDSSHIYGGITFSIAF